MAVLITGGSKGIGRAIAGRLAQPGMDVFLSYHSDDTEALLAADEIRALGAVPHLVKADMGSLADIEAMIRRITQLTDNLDVIVHAAAMAISGRITEIDGKSLDNAVATNGTSIVHIVREALPLLRPGASIIFVTSKGAERALTGYGALGGPKALGEHLVRYLATELAGRGIRVNSISPGPLDTDARRRMFPDTWQSRLVDQTRANPSGRGVEFDDVANIVELICDPRFTMVQGQVFTIDGGLTL
ncbi:SDR family oxidoreductase [Cryobacterium sp. TMS1-20-1]|uniref:SDR family oxidoreductase n=1 Tax=Cryobacterium sp. TMS1-20-1 TaxID=1259223 RepID=UPI00106C2F97|nr:SDR family oxidoreductase [Cryobacterium sp. TMS1-20-1]TFC80557.1 SDR family oxidoreductase [Cryobacterium sp. TMS1-20-1]